MTTTLEPRQMRMFRTAIGSFPAPWHFIEQRHNSINVETANPVDTVVLRITASAESEVILITLLRAADRQFMAEAQFPLSSWEAAKDFLESIALEAFVVGVDQRDGAWSGSMILRSRPPPRLLLRPFLARHVRSKLGSAPARTSSRSSPAYEAARTE